MCIAIVATAGAVVPQVNLEGSFAANGDGAGYAYVDKHTNEVVIKKGFFDIDNFMRSYKQTLDEGHGDHAAMLLHFRIATMGRVNSDNCHPFKIKGGALIHNGSLFYGRDPSGKDRSDTRIFAETLSDAFTYERVRNHREELTDIISFNKVAMLFDGGNYIILNEENGSWKDDVWYSNNSYLWRSGYGGYGGYYGHRRSSYSTTPSANNNPSSDLRNGAPWDDDEWDYRNG